MTNSWAFSLPPLAPQVAEVEAVGVAAAFPNMARAAA